MIYFCFGAWHCRKWEFQSWFLRKTNIIYLFRKNTYIYMCVCMCLKTFIRTSIGESKMNAVAHAQLTFQMLKISIPPKSVLKNTGQQISGPDSSNGLSIRHEFEGWGFEYSSGRDIFCFKHFDTLKRTSVRESKMNDVASNVNFTTHICIYR